jgi:hypothetical protein
MQLITESIVLSPEILLEVVVLNQLKGIVQRDVTEVEIGLKNRY